MELKRFEDINEFLEISEPVLIENEVENNLILGIVLYIQRDPTQYKEKYLAVMQEGKQIKAVSVCTPPHKILFWGKNENCENEIDLLVNDAVKSHLDTMGILASPYHALQIAKKWQMKTGRTFKLGMSERIYKLEKVIFPEQPSGLMRLATLEDLHLICQWMEEFREEAVPNDPLNDFSEFATKKIENKDLVIWDDKKAVALASKARNTINGTCINLVYTPKKFRRNGYATALVAHLSQKLLNDGWKFVILFTDLSNPTSNSIYQKVGFKPICDFQEYIFKTED
ncbi:MAG: GNAT family N-acetyltransferase [Candidatus Tenebribacter burtonii]|nr:GNAT family N-acetyltransferase [Candidatus Tenebribacter burtonii]